MGPVVIFCDVRDAALAHVRALEVQGKDVKGKRVFAVAGYFSNERIEKVVRGWEEGRGEGGSREGEKEDGGGWERWGYGFDNSRSREVLGLRYRGLKACVEDTVKAMVPLMEA